MSELNLETIIYFIRMKYDIDTDDLLDLSKNDLTTLMKLFSYSMAILIKYGYTSIDFKDRLWMVSFNECYDCGKNLLMSDTRHEIIAYSRDKVEYLCKKCYESWVVNQKD